MKTKPKPKIVRFSKVNDVYQYRLFVILGGTGKEAERWMLKKFKADKVNSSPDDEPASPEKRNRGATLYLPGESSHVLWFSLLSPGAGIISHEALHSVHHISRVIGLGGLTDDTEEAYAYLVAWTVTAVTGRAWK